VKRLAVNIQKSHRSNVEKLSLREFNNVEDKE
jgi:hypothetical protein